MPKNKNQNEDSEPEVPVQDQEEPDQIEPPIEQGEPESKPMHKEKDLTPEQIMALINNNMQATQNLAKAMGDGFKKIQAQDIDRVKDLDKRMDNLEQSVIKLVDFIKGQAPGVQQPMQPGQVQQGDPAQGQLTSVLGPGLAEAVMNELKPKDPYSEIGQALMNQQLKILTDPMGDPVRQIGQAVVDQITNQGVQNILNPKSSDYDREYMKAKAKKDAERDSIVEQAAVEAEKDK